MVIALLCAGCIPGFGWSAGWRGDGHRPGCPEWAIRPGPQLASGFLCPMVGNVVGQRHRRWWDPPIHEPGARVRCDCGARASPAGLCSSRQTGFSSTHMHVDPTTPHPSTCSNSSSTFSRTAPMPAPIITAPPAASPRCGNVVAPAEALQQVISQIRQHIQSPVLPLPDVQRGRRRRAIVPEVLCRRSACLQKSAVGKPAHCIKRAQLVLMSCMGICNIDDEPLVDCLVKYASLFRDPLPPHHIDALAKLFSLDMPFPEDSLSLEF